MTDTADQAALSGAKRQLRAAVRLRRASRGDAERAADDEARFALLTSMVSGRLPDTVAAYLSAGDEPDTLRLVAWLSARRVRVLLAAADRRARGSPRRTGLGGVRGSGGAPHRPARPARTHRDARARPTAA